jgi:hypothetical protein
MWQVGTEFPPHLGAGAISAFQRVLLVRQTLIHFSRSVYLIIHWSGFQDQQSTIVLHTDRLLNVISSPRTSTHSVTRNVMPRTLHELSNTPMNDRNNISPPRTSTHSDTHNVMPRNISTNFRTHPRTFETTSHSHAQFHALETFHETFEHHPHELSKPHQVHTFRPDRAVSAMVVFVTDALKLASLTPPPLVFKTVYEQETQPTEPVLFVTTTGSRLWSVFFQIIIFRDLVVDSNDTLTTRRVADRPRH